MRQRFMIGDSVYKIVLNGASGLPKVNKYEVTGAAIVDDAIKYDCGIYSFSDASLHRTRDEAIESAIESLRSKN